MFFRPQNLGVTAQGRPLLAYVAEPVVGSSSSHQPPTCLVLGGTHGDERATVTLLERWRDEARAHPSCRIVLMPCVNPDGYAAHSRYNARGVDINRNFPAGWRADSEEPSGASPLSEVESRALRDLVFAHEPRAIVSLHWALAEIDGDGAQSRTLVEAMWLALAPEMRTTYRRRTTLPSALQGPPGSFGRWAGFEVRWRNGQSPAMVTLELPYRAQPWPRPESLPPEHLDEVKQVWQTQREAYLDFVYPGLCAMLDAAQLWVEA